MKPRLWIKCTCGEWLQQTTQECGNGSITVTVQPCWWCIKVAKEAGADEVLEPKDW